ncbi:MAG: hypothetical protein ACE5J5_07580 [Candidatus Hydrothermarchaeales archaeon]
MPVKRFAKDYVRVELGKIGSTLGRRITVFLLGGCCMTFRDLKDATKDVDMVLTSPEDIVDVVDALKSLEYSEIKELPEEYEHLGSSAVLRNKNGFQLDLFLGQVCGGLEISEMMMGRAEFLRSYGNLVVYLMAPEDIFFFKSITEREADLLDMRTLVEAGLNWDIIKEECRLQAKRGIWEAFLLERLMDLKERYGIVAPIMGELRKIAGDELAKNLITGIIKDGNDTFDKIAGVVKKRFKYSGPWTRRELKKLEDAEVIQVEKKRRKYRYRLRQP